MKKPNFLEPIQNVLRDSGLRSRYMLNLSLWANLLVAAFKLILGIAVQSFWLGVVGVFYGVLALMRFSLLRSFRWETPDAEQRAYRRTAILMNVLTLTMTGIFVQMIRDDRCGMMLLSVGKPNGEDAKRSRNDMSLLHLLFLGTALWIASVGFTEYIVSAQQLPFFKKAEPRALNSQGITPLLMSPVPVPQLQV